MDLMTIFFFSYNLEEEAKENCLFGSILTNRRDNKWQRRNSIIATEDHWRVAKERSLGPDIYPGVLRKQLSEAVGKKCVSRSRKFSLSSHIILNSNVAIGTCKWEPLPGGGDWGGQRGYNRILCAPGIISLGATKGQRKTVAVWPQAASWKMLHAPDHLSSLALSGSCLPPKLLLLPSVLSPIIILSSISRIVKVVPIDSAHWWLPCCPCTGSGLSRESPAASALSTPTLGLHLVLRVCLCLVSPGRLFLLMTRWQFTWLSQYLAFWIDF